MNNNVRQKSFKTELFGYNILLLTNWVNLKINASRW